jgi:DNA-binding NtrC family response regulator
MLLVANRSGDSNAIVARAAEMTGHSISQVSDSRRAFEMLRSGSHNFHLLIIDVDSDIHPMAILEAVSACKDFPPIIVLTGREEYDMTPVAHRHGATACIGKPFSDDDLATLIEEVCPQIDTPNLWSCDLWGHPHRCHRAVIRKRAAGSKYQSRGAAAKFSAVSSK